MSKYFTGFMLLFLSAYLLHGQPRSGDELYSLLGKQLTVEEIEKLITDYELNTVNYSFTISPQEVIKLLNPFTKTEYRLTNRQNGNTIITFSIINRYLSSISVGVPYTPYAAYINQRFGIPATYSELVSLLAGKNYQDLPDGKWNRYQRWKEGDYSFFIRCAATEKDTVFRCIDFAVTYTPKGDEKYTDSLKLLVIPTKKSTPANMPLPPHAVFSKPGKPYTTADLKEWMNGYNRFGIKFIDESSGKMDYQKFETADGAIAFLQKLDGQNAELYLSIVTNNIVDRHVTLWLQNYAVTAVDINLYLNSELAKLVNSHYGFKPKSFYLDYLLEQRNVKYTNIKPNDKFYEWRDSSFSYELLMRYVKGFGDSLSTFKVKAHGRYTELKEYIKPTVKTLTKQDSLKMEAAQKFYHCVSGDCMYGWGKAFLGNTKFYYEGYFNKAMPSGVGKIVFTDKAFAQGNFSNGELHGKGMFNWGNGNVYTGEFSNGVPNGEGIYFEGAKYYEGPVVNGALTCQTCWHPHVSSTTPRYVNGQQWLLESADRNKKQLETWDAIKNAPTFMEWYQQRLYNPK